jgi:uncharacterized protein (DUF1697 family)
MTVFAALLRAINVGGSGTLRMADLKSLCEGLGYRNVHTLLQSGNVVFTSTGTDMTVARKLADAIENAHGFRPAIAVRSRDEIGDAMARNPFKAEEARDPTRLVVVFAAERPNAGAEKRIAEVKTVRERLILSEREVFAYYPDGQGRSKVTNAVLERALGVPATARNWNTVTKLSTLMQG